MLLNALQLVKMICADGRKGLKIATIMGCCEQ